jgi:hypothetical protein
MSDTPQTDEAQFGTGRVSVDFARRLERELVEAREQRDRLAEALREIANEDYRGFRPQSAIIAHKALSAMKGGSHDN